MITRKQLTLATISASIGLGLITGCEIGKKAEKKALPPPVLTDYTATKEGDWMNIANIFLFKENPSVVLKRYKDWIGRSYFNLISQRNRASFLLPPSKVLSAYEEKDGENPSIVYNCAIKKFGINYGQRMDAITGDTENSSYSIFRINGETQWAEENWQIENKPRKIEGIDPLDTKISGAPKGLPKSYQLKKSSFFIEDKDKTDPRREVLDAKTFEISIISKKDDETNGIYARWDFSPTLNELKANGDLDRACQMMLGSDYITIAPAKATKAEPPKTNNAKIEEKQ